MQFGEDAEPRCAQQFRNDGHGDVIHGPALVALYPIHIANVCAQVDIIAVFRNRGCWRIISASSKPSISGMLTSISTTAMSIFNSCSSASLAGSGLDQILAQFAEDGFIAQQLGGLIVHHQNVHFFVLHSVAVCLSARTLQLIASALLQNLTSIGAATCATPKETAPCSPASPDIQKLQLPGIFRGRPSSPSRSTR